MYFNEFPNFLYDFNYGDNKIKTSVVVDITRNIRFKKEILQNITVYDEYDIVDGETPEMISEQFYGTPEYHWVIMIANGKYDYRADFPMVENVLQKHIASVYNPKLICTVWSYETNTTEANTQNLKFVVDSEQPFDPSYLTSPVDWTVMGETTDGAFEMSFTWNASNHGSIDFNTQEFTQHIHETEYPLLTGDPVGPLTLITKGREFNPVFFVSMDGYKVNANSPGAIPITGDWLHRYENDQKRRIKIVSPTLLESIIRNFEEEL
jgi:hypothetical protein